MEARTRNRWTKRAGWLAAALPLTMLAGTPAVAEDDDVIGVVVAVRGTVTAQAPGEEPRLLDCDDPIREGDRIVTNERGQLGVLAQEFYTGVGPKSTLEVVTTTRGTPGLSLELGHLRLVDAMAAEPGRIQTPGVLASFAGTDTEALVFGEKGGVVSMVCPWDTPVDVTRVTDPGERLSADTGDCAISKPFEPLFVSNASHSKLDLIDDPSCRLRDIAAVGPRFEELPAVALGPTISGTPFVPALFPDPLRPCDNPGSGCVGQTGLPPSGPTPTTIPQDPTVTPLVPPPPNPPLPMGPPPTEFPNIPPPPPPPPAMPPPTEFPNIPPPPPMPPGPPTQFPNIPPPLP